VLDLHELLRLFDIGDLSSSPAVFDRQRLDWLNGKHLRAMPLERLVEEAAAFAPAWSGDPRFPMMVSSVLDNLTTLDELPAYLEAYGPPAVPEGHAAEWMHGEVAARVIAGAIEVMEGTSIGSVAEADDVIGEIKQHFADRDLKPKEVFMPLRVALTGRDRGPGMHYLLAVLGKEESIRRMRRALEGLNSGK
jgi:glutamyl/glutaminyl-tRNA synthetase